MGKKTKLREAQRQRAAEAIAAVLAARSHRAYPALVASYGDFKPHYHDQIEAYRAFMLRAPEKWRCRIKSRREDDRFLDLVKFVFAHYAVPAHLASAWLDADDGFLHDVAPAGIAADDCRDLRMWYIIAGQGSSLYRRATHPYLSRLETHHFLTAPDEVISIKRAFWYAIARASTQDTQAALNVARSQLADWPFGSAFRKEAARFFARERARVAEIDELLAFLDHAMREDESFSFSGRSLAALRRRKQDWERMQGALDAGCFGHWEGRAMPNAAYASGDGAEQRIWRFRQIKTGLGLFCEGQRMRHCVASYHSLC